MLPWMVTLLFAVTIGGLIALKYHAPDTDSVFIAVISTQCMGAVSFLVLHFKQQAIETKVDDKPTKVEVDHQTDVLQQAIQASKE